MVSSRNALPVLLGPVELTGLEVPEHFARGATMQAYVHRLIGGGRVVQLMGEDPARRSLAGTLSGPDAVERALTLEAMQGAGIAVPLVIGAWTELVVITGLVIDYAACGTVIRYRLLAEALPSILGSAASTAGAIIASAAGDLGVAASSLAAAAGFALSGAATILLGNQAALASTSTSVVPAVPAIAASTLLASAVATSGAALVANGGTGGDLVGGSGSLAAASANAGDLATATQAAGYVNRAMSGIAGLSDGEFRPTIHS